MTHSRVNHHRSKNNICTHSSSNSVFTKYLAPVILSVPMQIFLYLSLSNSHRNTVGDIPSCPEALLAKPVQSIICPAQLQTQFPPSLCQGLKQSKRYSNPSHLAVVPRGIFLQFETVSILPAEYPTAGTTPSWLSATSLQPLLPTSTEERLSSGMGEEGIELGSSTEEFTFPCSSGNTQLQVLHRYVSRSHLIS